MRGLHTQHDKKTKTYLQDQKQHTAASHKHRYMMQWLLKGFFLISVVLWHILRWRFLLVYLHPCLLFPSFRQNLLLWPPIWLDCGRVCVCVHVPACVFPSFIDTLRHDLLLRPCSLPLSVHPFLLWWRPAWVCHSFNWDTRWTLTFLPVCLFPVSFRFRVCLKKGVTAWSGSEKKLWQELTLLIPGLNVAFIISTCSHSQLVNDSCFG